MKQPKPPFSVIRKAFFEKALRSPKSPLPEVKPDMNEFLAPSETLKFIWFGHSTLLLNMDGKIILIDPVFSDYASPVEFLIKRFQPPVLKLDELPPIDAIIISHDHYDHLDKKTILHFKNKATGFILPRGVGSHLKKWGIAEARITELDLHESVHFQGLTLTTAPAQHFSGRGLFDRNKTLYVSWIIQGQMEKIFYSGDSGYGEHFKQIGAEHGPFDVTFIENGQYNESWRDVHMFPEDTIQAHLDLNGNLLVPVHWGMFDLALHHWNDPVKETFEIATNWEIPFYVPRLGQIVSTAHELKTLPWWEEQEIEALDGLFNILNYQSR